MRSHHKYECRIASALERTQLHRLPLVMASLRAITQKPASFFIDEAAKGTFGPHNVQHGAADAAAASEDFVYRSEDYSNLYNLVTHSERRSPLDIVTKYIIAGILVTMLKAVSYFDSSDWEMNEPECLIGNIADPHQECPLSRPLIFSICVEAKLGKARLQYPLTSRIKLSSFNPVKCRTTK